MSGANKESIYSVIVENHTFSKNLWFKPYEQYNLTICLCLSEQGRRGVLSMIWQALSLHQHLIFGSSDLLRNCLFAWLWHGKWHNTTIFSDAINDCGDGRRPPSTHIWGSGRRSHPRIPSSSADPASPPRWESVLLPDMAGNDPSENRVVTKPFQCIQTFNIHIYIYIYIFKL